MLNDTFTTTEKMRNYRKLAAAFVGIATLIAAKYGLFDLSLHNEIFIDGLISAMTLYGVYLFPNTKPTIANTKE